MKIKYVFLFPLLLFGLFLTSCTNNSNNPVTPNPVGSIFVSSTPASAQIWLDGTNTGKVTPDSVANINVGSHTVMLKLTNYLNDSVTVNVQEGLQTTLNRTLVSDISVTVYGPVTVWESADPLATDPSGIVLKSGQAVSIGSSTYGPVDIYYSSNQFVVATAYGLYNNTGRSTYFYVGSAKNLTDGVSSPLATNSWLTEVNDTQTNYFFLFDSDSHYSKMIITGMGGGTPGNPAWINVKWLYNNKPNDQRF
jgi:PEGA domain